MRGLKKGTPPPPDKYYLIGNFGLNGMDWYVYRRNPGEADKFCNMKVIHPKKPKVGTSNVWAGYFMGEGDSTRLVMTESVAKTIKTHEGFSDALLAFCRDKMPETFD